MFIEFGSFFLHNYPALANLVLIGRKKRMVKRRRGNSLQTILDFGRKSASIFLVKSIGTATEFSWSCCRSGWLCAKLLLPHSGPQIIFQGTIKCVVYLHVLLQCRIICAVLQLCLYHEHRFFGLLPESAQCDNAAAASAMQLHGSILPAWLSRIVKTSSLPSALPIIWHSPRVLLEQSDPFFLL